MFPCYNSVAVVAVATTAFNGKEYCPEISHDDIIKWILKHRQELLKQFPESNPDSGSSGEASDVHCGSYFDSQKLFNRRQLLNVIVMTEVEKMSRKSKLMAMDHPVWRAIHLGLILGLAAVLVACGCFGSGLIVAIGGISRYLAQNTNLKRSPLYRRNRETHEGCMLVAVHENATIWTLCLGNRGLIDTLLNKPMIDPGKTNPLIIF